MRIKLFGNIESARMEAKLNVGTCQAMLPFWGKPLGVARWSFQQSLPHTYGKSLPPELGVSVLSWGQVGSKQYTRYLWIRSLKRNPGWAAALSHLFLGVGDARVRHRVFGLHLSHPELPQFLHEPFTLSKSYGTRSDRQFRTGWHLGLPFCVLVENSHLYFWLSKSIWICICPGQTNKT